MAEKDKTPQTNNLSSALELIIKIREEPEVEVVFVKKDGTERLMKCTLDFKKIPKRQHPKKFDLTKMLKLIQKSGVIHVYDIPTMEWRSIPFKKTKYLITQDRTKWNIIHK